MTINVLFMQKTSWKNLFAYMGPGFLVSIAYIDPGNCEIITYYFTSCFYICFVLLNITSCFVVGLQLRRICSQGRSTNMGCVIINAVFLPLKLDNFSIFERIRNGTFWNGILLSFISCPESLECNVFILSYEPPHQSKNYILVTDIIYSLA